MYTSAESENLESLRILAYLVDTGHVPPSALREVSEMDRGVRFPYYLPNVSQASSILRLLPSSHPYHQQAAK